MTPTPDRGEYPRALSQEEENAIASLRRLAKRWPPTLTLFSAAGSLVVTHTYDDLGPYEGGEFEKHVKATIRGIPNDGGDPW
jgi:hypothetical protein